MLQHCVCNFIGCGSFSFGAVVGAVGALLYYVSIELGSSDHVTTNALTFDVVAFLLGFGDKAFRQLITKLTGLLISPGKSGG